MPLEDHTTILVVDDHPIFRDGVSAILRDIQPSATILVAGSGTEALAQVKQHRDIDWIFLDIKLPDLEASALLPMFDRLNLFASVVIVSSEDNPETIDAMLRAGANGFLSKTSDQSEFNKCMKQIEAGRFYIQASAVAGLQHFREVVLVERRCITDSLSSRQHEVLALLASGLSNSEIGASLSISESTVKSHVSCLLEALAADSRTHCVAQARRLGILS